MIGNPTEEELYREAELLDLETALADVPKSSISDAPHGFDLESEPEMVTWQQP